MVSAQRSRKDSHARCLDLQPNWSEVFDFGRYRDAEHHRDCYAEWNEARYLVTPNLHVGGQLEVRRQCHAPRLRPPH